MRKLPKRRAFGTKPLRNTQTVAEYIAAIPKPARGLFGQLRTEVRSAVPRDATEIISYGIPAFKTDRVLVWFAAFSNHCSLFPGSSVIEAFKEQLGGFSTSKGTVHFRLDKPLPVALVKKLVKARVAEFKSGPSGR